MQNNKLFEFIKNSPSAYNTVSTVENMLKRCGYTELFENGEWTLSDGGKYYVTKNGSSIIAFRYKKCAKSFMICASHGDSPAFRLKPSLEKKGKYITADVEKYGGMIYYSWLDRPLSIAGRVMVKTENGISSRVINIDKDLAVIPSLAIHFNRTSTGVAEFNPAIDMLPLVTDIQNGGALLSLIARECGVCEDAVVSHDLFFYVREAGRTCGANGEFLISPRLDDLACAYASSEAFLAANEENTIPVLAVFDNEEVGSETKQGAASSFFSDTISEIAGDKLRQMISQSLMVSADNGHAIHPNRPEFSDSGNAPMLNGGVVIKYNANQRYSTDAVSAALFSQICKAAGAKTQNFCNRADILGGSTLGSIATTKLPVMTLDIGLPQLAMHSAVETTGAHDLSEMIKALTAFYSSRIEKTGGEYKILMK
jgi:aspartyl aminopeptidase